MGPQLSVVCECISKSKPKALSCLDPKLLQLKLSEANIRSTSLTSMSTTEHYYKDQICNDSKSLSSPCKLSIKNFVIQKVLGSGAFGKVLLVRKKNKSSKFYAMKIMRKSEVYAAAMGSNIKLEQQILQKSNNPFIVQLNYSFQTKTKIYLVMEYLSGGDLYYLLRKKKRFSLHTARFYLAEVILALEYLHKDLKLIYRDLKPENILLTKEGHIKVTDFGLSKKLCEKCMSFVGTPEYVSPEVILNQEQSTSVDLWSCGILLFEMLAGSTPFSNQNKNLEEIQKKILRRDFKFPNYFTEESKDLIEKLLKLDPKERISINLMKTHNFFEDIDWNKVENLGYQTPFKMTVERFNQNEQKELEESYDLNSLPDLEGLTYDNDQNNCLVLQ